MSKPLRSRRIPIPARVALVFALLLLAAVLSQPWWLAAVLGDYLSQSSGRDVHFDSARVGLTMTLAPVVVLRGVRIANASWADTRQPFAVLEEVTFQFWWHRYEGRWVVAHAMFRDGEVNFAQQADGLRNWRLRHPWDRGPGHFWFFAVEPHRAALRFAQAGIDLQLQASASDIKPAPAITVTADGLVNNITFDGVFRGIAFKGNVAAGQVLSMMKTGHWFALRGSAAIAGARFDIDGRAADLVRDRQVDAEVVVDGNSLAALRPLLGERYVEPRAFHVAGRAHVAPGHYALDGAQARIGATDFAGELAWSADGARKTVHANLLSHSTDMADLLWLAGRATADSAKPGAAANSPSPSPAFHSFDAIRDVNADLRFEAQRLHIAAVPALQSLKLNAALADSQLNIKDLDAGWGGGHSSGVLALDLRKHPARADLRVDTHGVRVESLLPSLDNKHRITGALRSHLALQASGDDLAALRASVAGTITATLADGTIPKRLDALMGLEGGKLVRSLGRGSHALPLPCAAMTAEVSAGTAHVRSLVIASANTRITGSGTLDLRTAIIDLALTPESVQPGLFELNRSIHLSGKLPRPQRSLVARLAPVSGAGCEPAAP